MGKTITTHFLEGTPKGIQSIQLSNRTLIAYVVPRSEISKCKELTELQTPCLYILFGETEEGISKAYIGETDNFLKRVEDHNRKKDFWHKAFVFSSIACNLNKADIMYLEYLAVDLAMKVKNCDLTENKQTPTPPTLQRYAIDTMDEFFEDVKFITEFGGYDIFKLVEEVEKLDQPFFYLKTKKVEAKGFYDESGFTVLKGSVVANNTQKSHSNPEKREGLIEQYGEIKNNITTLISNIRFNSPSTAGRFVCGSSQNGWDVWKTEDGRTLDAVYRNN